MIIFVPVGGLANRMRAIASAIALAQDTHTNLRVIWYKDQGLNLSFKEIFCPLRLPGVELRDASFGDLLLHDRPRKKNLYVPYLFQMMRFRKCLYEDEVSKIQRTGFDFKGWVGSHNVYIASHDSFYPSGTDLSELFKPVDPIQKRIQEQLLLFNDSTIGIHIRRTDHAVSISESPTELFIEAMEKEMSRDPQTRFYVATDSEEDKDSLMKKFGGSVITSANQASRNTRAGIEEAVADLFLLAKTKKILGSLQSSFSEIAAQLGHIPLIVLRRK